MYSTVFTSDLLVALDNFLARNTILRLSWQGVSLSKKVKKVMEFIHCSWWNTFRVYKKVRWFRKVFWCLQFLPKMNENTWHSSKNESICFVFWKNSWLDNLLLKLTDLSSLKVDARFMFLLEIHILRHRWFGTLK